MNSVKRFIIMLVSLALIIGTATVVLKYKGNTVEAKPIKDKVDIGGYGLYVNYYGKGKQTVIFESEYAGTLYDWGTVQSEISKTAKTFSYNRAGLVKSDTSKLQRTSLNKVQELHELLNKSGAKGPYIIVASGFGGFNARLFATTYPKEVAGIVFVNGASENWFDSLTSEEHSNNVNQLGGYKSIDGDFSDLETSAEQVKDANTKDSLRNIPIAVISYDYSLGVDNGNITKDQYEQFTNWQKDLTKLSDKSKQYTIKDDGNLLADKQQDIIDTIKEMINTVNK